MCKKRGLYFPFFGKVTFMVYKIVLLCRKKDMKQAFNAKRNASIFPNDILPKKLTIYTEPNAFRDGGRNLVVGNAQKRTHLVTSDIS